MSAVQQFFTTIFPRRWAESMERESRRWMLRCRCGFEVSVWEAGGIRWLAAGNPRKVAICPTCGPVWMKLEKTPSGVQDLSLAADTGCDNRPPRASVS